MNIPRHAARARYEHERQLPTGKFDPKTFRTVPIEHTGYKGKKFATKGTKAVVGKLKGDGWATQSILVPKESKQQRLAGLLKELDKTKDIKRTEAIEAEIGLLVENPGKYGHGFDSVQDMLYSDEGQRILEALASGKEITSPGGKSRGSKPVEFE